MSPRPLIAAGIAVLATMPVPAVAAGPLQVTSRVLVERRVAAADGTTRIVASPGRRAAPGDRLLVEITYRNTGARPIADLVLADPVPAELAFKAAAPGSPVPDTSVDGTTFTPFAGDPAQNRAIVAVRWRIAGALAPGAGGTLAYRAVLK